MTSAGVAERKRLIGATRRSFGRADPILTKLAGDLFADVSVEDLRACTPEEIAGFVASAYELLAKRRPGHHVIRISDPGFAKDVTLIEILNDNMPFLVDSVMGELQDFGVVVMLVAHPIVSVDRDRKGILTAYHGSQAGPKDGIRESLIQVHIDRLKLPKDRENLEGRLDSLLVQVRRAVDDWHPMQQRLWQAVAAYKAAAPPPIDEDEWNEAIAFLDWLLLDNFTFLGIRQYDFVGGAEKGELRRRETPGLGILSDPDVRVLRRGGQALMTTPAVREFLMRPEPLIIAKANVKSRIHRRAYMDYVGVKLYSTKGKLAGELRVIGLFTSTAYTRSVRAIPYLRRKVDHIIARAGFEPSSHSGKALVNVLESYPRDELFQVDEDTLFEFATAILDLELRPRIRVLPRRDKFDRFVSIIVFVPRDRYDSDVRARIGEYLAKAYDGRVSAFYPAFPEGTLARVHFIIGRDAGLTPEPDRSTVETAVAAIVRSWTDGLREALTSGSDPIRADRLIRRYQDAFAPAYRDDVSPNLAVADIEAFERLRPERALWVVFAQPAGKADHQLKLRLYHLGSPIPLSDGVPMLENMGFRVIDERTYPVEPADGPPLYLHDMSLETADGHPIDCSLLSEKLTACFIVVWHGRAESDGYNALVVNAGLAWRDIALLRTASRYLRQAGSPYSQHYMWGALNRHTAIAVALVEMFHARFGPATLDPKTEKDRHGAIEAALEKVQSLDEDRIVRAFVNLIGAMVRTNFFQIGADGTPHAEISFKLDSKKIDNLPAPRPFREIFVYSPRVEGVHLRFGKVARGGIRWSDRPQDFRTEVLGLVKAQQVKNAVIVPVGAKGGFVPKLLPIGGTRDAIMAEGIAAYRTFISSLLDITDNLDGETVVPPEQVVRHDEDDPYLVVAADKGTATFSDIANGVATGRGFWLGDAFASGGSAGYDHKKMGITARGAWEAVKRHFREMDVDIQKTPFTCVGVGDMSGDVFGNGMLLSPVTRLVAAFDHRDIFVDPDPDPATALAERKRLFDLPRSSWQDYDRKKISAGGGVFSRSEKAIALSRQMKALLGLAAEKATPQEVARAILKAPIDLLWFGGIGTFVRDMVETDDQVGDRANDGIRITATEIGAKVVGEGANLAMTQRARIAFCLAGGRCNSDAIDNSAGVNTSDVEVNIKIALGRAERLGALDRKNRDRLLKAMTGEVTSLVLRNNYLQTLAISLTEHRGFEDFGFQLRFMQALEERGLLDRRIEALPDDMVMAERHKAGKPLTRPEIAVLLAYAKLTLFDELIAGGVADDPAFEVELTRYFPNRMQEKYHDAIEAHRLRREIIATVLGNSMINRGGPTYLTRIIDRTGAKPADVARAYLTVRDSFALQDLNGAIDALDNRIPGAMQLKLYGAVQDLVLAKTVWFLRNVSFADGVEAILSPYHTTIAEVGSLIGNILPPHQEEEIDAEARAYRDAGVPGPLALRIARLPALADATDIHLAATASDSAIRPAAMVFFAVAEHLKIARIEALARALPVVDHFDGLALDRALETLARAHRDIAVAALAAGGNETDPLGAWLKTESGKAEGVMETVTEMTEGGELTVSRAIVAANLLSDLAVA